MNLNETWELCIKMWKWVAKVYDGRISVTKLKKQWMREHKFRWIKNDCFFCDWRIEMQGEFEELWDMCNSCDILCPAKLASDSFAGCGDMRYYYCDNPKAFYQEIKRIYEIRESMKK